MNVGFIGLGNQGAPIARKISRSGYRLYACDCSPHALEAFDEQGATRLTEPIETARQVEVLCVCVRMDKDLIDLVAGGALFAALGSGGTFIIHSTVEHTLCQQLAELGARYGVSVLDAGVSGGGDAALQGQLALFVGGDAAAFERVRPLLSCYGKSVAYLGPSGRGMIGKLLNNLVSIANYGMAAAILDLGEALHFDREQLRRALLAGSAEGFALRAIPGLLQPERAAWLHEVLAKDLDHARSLAASAPPVNKSLAAIVAAAQSMIDRLAALSAKR